MHTRIALSAFVTKVVMASEGDAYLGHQNYRYETLYTNTSSGAPLVNWCT